MSETYDWSDDPRLVAYALGELEGDDRTEVERALSEDPRCRAALREIQGFLPEVERAVRVGAAEAGLGEGARAEIVDAARRGASRPRPVWRHPVLAAAAAIVVAVVGVRLALNPRTAPDVRVATADAPAPSAGSSAGVESVRKRRAPGMALSESEGARAGIDAAPAPSTNTRVSRAEPIRLELERELGADVPRGRRKESLEEPTREEFEVSLARTEANDELQRADVTEDSDLEDLLDLERRAEIPENPFVRTASDPLSTFSIDVDTASYANVRRAIEDGRRPSPAEVRIEEFVNYFTYDDAPPAADDSHPFRVTVQTGSAPWNAQHRLVRIGLKGRAIEYGERPPANLVFLVDVSGSMNAPDKLPMVKDALAMLTGTLEPNDRVAIVVYASAQGLALASTPVAAREAILQALERLEAGGSTNGEAGIELAYSVASEHLVEGGTNRVILCTDGDFNVGVTSDEALEALIAEKAASGIDLTILGFGTGNFQDEKMERLSNRGNGNFAYLDSELEARRVLVTEVGGTLNTIARDVKVQVAWNPARVRAARLIGYENRMLEHRDFRDDAKDAGEIGAGHGVTALYEVIPWGLPAAGIELEVGRPDAASVDAAGGAPPSGPLVTVQLRYKPPGAVEGVEFAVAADDPGESFDGASTSLRFAASVAAFGMVLRESKFAGETTLSDVRRWALEAVGEDPGGLREAFVELVEKADALDR